MQSILTKFLVQHLPQKPCKIIIGFSGGVDSTVLLHLVSQVKQQWPKHNWLAVHVNHGISPLADSWQRYCEQLCQQINMPVVCDRYQVTAKARESLEQNARNVRYQSFHNHTEDGDVVLLAHHLQDQAESVLLQLKRGAGPKGLSAMAKSITRDGRHVMRPLLGLHKNELIDYAKQQQLVWIEDESNQDCQFDRNFLRHQITPLLEQRWPGFLSSVARSSELCAEQQQLIEQLAAEDLANIVDHNNCIGVGKLSELSDIRQRMVLRAWIESFGGRLPSKAILQQIQEQLLYAKPDADPVISWSKIQVRRYKGKLFLLQQLPNLSEVELTWLDIEQSIGLPSGQTLRWEDCLGLEKPDASTQVVIKFSQNSRHYFVGQKKELTINKLLKQYDLAPWLREQTPLVYFDEQLRVIPKVALVVLPELSKVKDV